MNQPTAKQKEEARETAWQIVQRYYPGDDELANAIREALEMKCKRRTESSLLSSEVAWKIALHIKGKNPDYFHTQQGLAELEGIVSRHFANAALRLLVR